VTRRGDDRAEDNSTAMVSRSGTWPASFGPEPQRFKQVLGHFATGVTVITTSDGDGPAGFSCQSFTALSLEPPLVLFCPARTSATWPRIRRAGYFCANVLSEKQRDLASVFGRPGRDKFAGVSWTPSAAGAPVLAGALAWAGCSVETVYPGGDHMIVVGRVTELGEYVPQQPLLLYRGRFAALPADAAAGPAEIVETLLSWPRHADWM
jgi:3-hydroxy-9,10-secoandrosta-1,3,5(10)-triene-9,17-dione monooxygenase reductase component